MNNWKEYKLSDLMQIKYGKDHKHLADGPFPLYGSGGIMRYVEKPLYSEASILIPRKGTLSNLFFLDKPFWSVDTMFYSIINKQLALPKYLYYTLKTFDLASLNVGSAVPSLTTEVLNDVLVSVPDIDTQTAIAEILSSLDDKIELNNKINQELENLAQTLFKQWFIDFEFPNENREPYKSAGGEMVDSELGEIPMGWRVRSLYEIAQINLGGTPSRSKREYWNGDIPWVNSGAINENYILKPTEFISEVGLKKSSTKLITKYSTLIAITGATLGQVSYSLIDACYNQSVISLTSENNINEFIHLLIISIIPELIKHQTGGAQQHINKGNVESFKVKYPNENLLIEFKSLITDLYCRNEINIRENQELNNLRDTLLPKLISGELEVSEALTQTTA
jgi:type I restriction enzyme S subunit